MAVILLFVEEPRNTRRIKRSLIVAHGCVVLGLVASLYGNVASAWPDRVLMGFGVAASLGLPAAVALWRAIPVIGWWRRFRRGGVMFIIAASAAIYTFAHVVGLQIDHGQHPILAMCVTALIEGLVVMAVLTLHAATEPATDQVSVSTTVVKRTPSTRRMPGPASAPTVKPTVIALSPGRAGTKREQALAWLAEQQAAGKNLDEITGADVDRVIGSNDYARKHLSSWRAELNGTRQGVAR